MDTQKSYDEFRSAISIIEIATAYGYTVDKSAGLKWPVLKHDILGDKIIIVNARNAANQGYWNVYDDTDRGTLINFIKTRLGSIFPFNSLHSEAGNINSVLYHFLNLPSQQRAGFQNMSKKITDKKIIRFFEIPKSLRPLDNREYLRKRGLSDLTIEVFSSAIRNLQSSTFDNVAFPYFDAGGRVVGLEIRNTRFKKMEQGSNRSVGIWHTSIPVKGITSVILTESPIDAMSYYQLKGERFPGENTLYVAFGGTVGEEQLNTLTAIVRENAQENNMTFISAVDNDLVGKAYTEKFKTKFENVVEDYPIGKDYNEDLNRQIKSAKKLSEDNYKR